MLTSLKIKATAPADFSEEAKEEFEHLLADYNKTMGDALWRRKYIFTDGCFTCWAVPLSYHYQNRIVHAFAKVLPANTTAAIHKDYEDKPPHPERWYLTVLLHHT